MIHVFPLVGKSSPRFTVLRRNCSNQQQQGLRHSNYSLKLQNKFIAAVSQLFCKCLWTLLTESKGHCFFQEIFMLANPSQPILFTFQVKLSYQETELVTLLKRLPLAHAELTIIREKAQLLQQGQLKRGDAVLPIMLATFIFEVLCPKNCSSQAKRQATVKLCETTREDEELGFQATLFVLGTTRFT